MSTLPTATHSRAAIKLRASSLAEHKLKDVREKMADLARMEAVLSELVCACHARRGNVSCPLIASLQGGASLAGSAMP